MENKNSKTELIPKTDSKNETILINNKSISKPNDKQSFLIYHTLIAKGIASLMLLYHHLLREGNKFNKGFYNELIIFNINFRKYISIFFKITTCSYTFLSGIGLYYSLIKLKSIKEMYKKCMKNFFRLMVIFWIILIFVFPKGLIFYFIYFIIKIFRTSITFNSMFSQIFFDYFFYFSYIDIILSFISGILAAKYNIMLVYDNPNYECFYYCLFSIFSSVYIRWNLISQEGDTKIDFFIVPLFLLPITSLISKKKIIANIISLFGKHSTNFWFIHGYFYDNYYLDILSLPKYSTLCYIWLIILTLISSYIINIVQIPIINFINSKGFNYKGYFHFIKI